MSAITDDLEEIPLIKRGFEGVVLLENYDSSDEELRTDQDSLRSRGKLQQTNLSNEILIQKEIKEGETLQTMSLAFGCKVAEIKRVNNLMQDQDFFALKYIKVPVKRHGLITELLSTEGKYKQDNSLQSEAVHPDECDTSRQDNLNDHNINVVQEVRTLSIGSNFYSKDKEARNFFEKMDSDLKNIVTSTKNQLDSLEEATTSLTCRRIFPMRQKRQQSWGADCGIRWWNIVLAVFLIGLVIPLMYFFYFEFIKPS